MVDGWTKKYMREREKKKESDSDNCKRNEIRLIFPQLVSKLFSSLVHSSLSIMYSTIFLLNLSLFISFPLYPFSLLIPFHFVLTARRIQ